jgi:hypothetical protein
LRECADRIGVAECPLQLEARYVIRSKLRHNRRLEAMLRGSRGFGCAAAGRLCSLSGPSRSSSRSIRDCHTLIYATRYYFVAYCHHRGLAAKACLAFGTDPIEEITNLAEKIYSEFPHSIFFTSKLIFERELVYPSAAQ